MRNCVAAATLLLAMLDTGVVVVTGAPTMRPTFAGMCGGAELASCDAINGFCACSNLACTGTLCGCNAGYECSGAGLSGCLVCSLAAPPAGAPTMNPDAPSRAPTAGPPSAPEPESTRQLAGSTEARDIFMATEMSIVLGLIAALCCTGCFASAIGVAAFYIVRLARATYEGELLPPLPGGAEWPWWKRMDSDLTAVGALAQRVFGAVRDAIDGTPAALRRGRVRLDEESGVELRFDERPPDGAPPDQWSSAPPDGGRYYDDDSASPPPPSAFSFTDDHDEAMMGAMEEDDSLPRFGDEGEYSGGGEGAGDEYDGSGDDDDAATRGVEVSRGELLIDTSVAERSGAADATDEQDGESSESLPPALALSPRGGTQVVRGSDVL